MSFRKLKSSSRGEWLEQRQNYLTATEIKTLMMSGPDTWENVKQSKLEPPREFDSKALAWGREREPVIAQYVHTFIDSSLQPNSELYVSMKYPRIAATPDMVSEDALGDVMSAEIKTSQTDLSIIPLEYQIQMEVQMLVLGTSQCFFVWEQHDDFIPRAIQHVMYESKATLRVEVLEVVGRFYGDNNLSERELRLQSLLKKQAEVELEESQLNLKKENIRQEIITILGDEDASFSSPQGKITWFTSKPRETFDSKRFAEEHPDIYSQYVKVGAPGKKSLRITLPKG